MLQTVLSADHPLRDAYATLVADDTPSNVIAIVALSGNGVSCSYGL